MVIANVVNIVLELVLVYGLDLGLDGSASAPSSRSSGWAPRSLAAAARAGRDAPPRVGADPAARRGSGAQILVRTGVAAAGASCVASAVLARTSDAALAANQVVFQLFVFLALVLDALAIAGQVMVGRALGGGDATEARVMGRRRCELSFAAGLLIDGVLLALVRRDPARVHERRGRARPDRQIAWPIFALLLPFAAIVFALDGILIGAGDTRYLARRDGGRRGGRRRARAADAALDWGIAGIWAAIGGADGRAPRDDGGALRRRALGARRRARREARADLALGRPSGSANPACRQPRSISAITASITAMRAQPSCCRRGSGATAPSVVSVRSSISSTAAA